ncbi:retrovirus-related pol polyprotein from transposon TNT 1-94 [Tanacetum coccineum]
MNQFCERKGIKREFSIARTPQQNGVAGRKNITLIEAAKTMLADSKLPTTFWAEAVNTDCLLYHLGKFDGKADEGFFVGYSINSKAFKVFNSRTRIVEENLHVQFSENTPNIARSTKACDDAEGGDPSKEDKRDDQEKDASVNSTNNVNATSTNEVNVVSRKESIKLPDNTNMHALEDIVYSNNDEDVGAEADMNNLDAFMLVSPIPTTRVHKNHPVEQIIRDLNSAPQTRRMIKNLEEHGRTQKGTKWVFRNKKDERGIVIKNKARLVAQGYIQEEWIDYDEVFSPVARIEAIRLFLAYALFKDFVVYQMDVNSAFLYGKIEEEVYVYQPPGFEDPDFPDRVYKVEKALYGLHQAPRAWYETLSTYLLDNGMICTEFEKMMHNKFQMSFIDELTFFLGLQVKQKEDGIFINQDKYVTKILKKFGFTDVKTASTPMKTQKLLLKDEDGEEVDVHLYRSMIGSLMYLTSSRLDIIYLKGQSKLGLWYLKDSPFDLVAYTDSDYAGASLDRKSTTGGCQFFRCRLISWRCKKQTMVENSTIEAEYVAPSSCCGQAKTVNEEVQLHALVDGKKVIITESTIRRDLHLEDAEGVDCLPNAANLFENYTNGVVLLADILILVGIKRLHDDLEVTAAKWDQQVVSELVALRNFAKKKLLLHSRSVCYKEMDQDSAHMVAASKVPMLKPGEYELWRMRMEQYIQMIDYSLWEVIENGNAPLITKVVEGVETIIAPTTAEEKAQRRLG